jgi:hypothetical protein
MVGCCLSFDIRILITHLVSSNSSGLVAIILYVLLQSTVSDCLFSNFKLFLQYYRWLFSVCVLIWSAIITKYILKSDSTHHFLCSWRVSSSCSTSGTRRVYLVIDTVISHEWGKDREVFTTSGTYYVIYDTYILFICSNISVAPTYGMYISQMIRYSRACVSYEDFLDRGLLLTRKLLNQGFLLAKLKSPLSTFYGRHHDLVRKSTKGQTTIYKAYT